MNLEFKKKKKKNLQPKPKKKQKNKDKKKKKKKGEVDNFWHKKIFKKFNKNVLIRDLLQLFTTFE